MLVSLAIRDVVLIEKLDLFFTGGLSVFTGETGAGKSILLDSLSLALGARADSSLVRHGASQLSVTAEFDPLLGHPARRVLSENELDANGGPIVLRRIVSNDGRSRAYVNDQAVSVGLLRKIGDALVEIHGQFDSHGLLDATTHLGVLDSFAVSPLKRQVKDAHEAWQKAAKARAEAEDILKRARAEEDELRFAFDELKGLAPQPGEESELAQQRAMLQHGEKLVEGMNAAMAALTQRGDVAATLRTAQWALERVADRAAGKLDEVINSLDRAATEAAEASALLERASAEIDMDPRRLESVEERLFALRAAARKYAVDVDDLALLKDKIAQQLAALDGTGGDLAKLARAEAELRTTYVQLAKELSEARHQAAQALDAGVMAELAPLKLEKARFMTEIAALPESDWNGSGMDGVEFKVATNPGNPPAGLGKVASGGELSRFMLALKVVLAKSSTTGTMVFDEVDSGIGGAVAAAVGERLARLGHDAQVLVVTHSPQVAGRGRNHYKVAKAEQNGQVFTHVGQLSHDERREEIARMLSGEIITAEARAAADQLLS